MEKTKQKELMPETDGVKAVEEIPQGVTVGMGAYKPIPKFRSGCPNC